MPDSMIPFDQLPPDFKNRAISACTSEECDKAKKKITPLRNSISIECSNIAAARGRRDAYAAVVASLLVVATALAVAAATASATIFGIPAGVVLILAAAGFLVAAGVAAIPVAVAQGEIDKATATKAELLKQLSDAINEMTMKCSEYCLSDTTLPSCP